MLSGGGCSAFMRANHRILVAKSDTALGPPGFVIQLDGTNRIAEAIHVKQPSHLERRRIAAIARFTNTPIRESGQPATQRRTEQTITIAVKGSDQGARKITPRLETANERPASSQSRPTARIPSSPISMEPANNVVR
jgi:hypothetical protein